MDKVQLIAFAMFHAFVFIYSAITIFYVLTDLKKDRRISYETYFVIGVLGFQILVGISLWV